MADERRAELAKLSGKLGRSIRSLQKANLQATCLTAGILLDVLEELRDSRAGTELDAIKRLRMRTKCSHTLAVEALNQHLGDVDAATEHVRRLMR